jgi:acyl-CoA synthetase (AMP-forming)/AMP-acid ligase II
MTTFAPPPALHRLATPLLHDFLENTAARLPDKVALVCKGVRVTYARARPSGQRASRTRSSSRGVERGDRVVVFADNTVETVVSFWAVLKANAIVSIINPLTKHDKLTYLLNDCRAKVLLTDMHLASVFTQSAPNTPHLVRTIVSGAFDAEADGREEPRGVVERAHAWRRRVRKPRSELRAREGRARPGGAASTSTSRPSSTPRAAPASPRA